MLDANSTTTTATPPPPAPQTPRLSALLGEIEREVAAALAITSDDDLPDEHFNYEERGEITRRLSEALRRLRTIQQ